ncbi:MAG: PGPGW domain-containing protein [Mycobacteriales bacterium]
MLRRHARKVGIFIVGWLVVIGGLILVPLPGPGWAIVFVGLSLLATEFAWAARLKTWVQEQLRAWMHKVQLWRAKRRRRPPGIVDEAIDDVFEDVEDGVTEEPTPGPDRNRSIAS